MLRGLRLLITHPTKDFIALFTQETIAGHLLCVQTMLNAGDTGMRGTDELPVLGRSQKIRRKNEQENASDTGNEEGNGSCARGCRAVRGPSEEGPGRSSVAGAGTRLQAVQAACTAGAKALRRDQLALHFRTTARRPPRRGSGPRGPSHPVPRGGGQGAGPGPGWRKWGQDPGGQTPLGRLISRVPVTRRSPGSSGGGRASVNSAAHKAIKAAGPSPRGRFLQGPGPACGRGPQALRRLGALCARGRWVPEPVPTCFPTGLWREAARNPGQPVSFVSPTKTQPPELPARVRIAALLLCGFRE